MSDRRRAFLERVAAAARRRDEARPAFLDGLLVGAMVGAAIAGSTLWSRWHARRSRATAPHLDGRPGTREEPPAGPPQP